MRLSTKIILQTNRNFSFVKNKHDLLANFPNNNQPFRFISNVSIFNNPNYSTKNIYKYNSVEIQQSQHSSQSTDCKSLDKNKWQEPPGSDTGIKIYNCVAKTKVPLILKNKSGTWYSCGPTVYDSAHVGHASCYVKLDIIQRILTNYFNIDLVTCMGVTDIDDKIIKRSNDTGKSINEITKTYEAEFWKNMSDLGIAMPDIVTRVTDHIPVIVKFIDVIMKRKLGYVTTDKSVCFDTVAYENYGKLQNPQQRDDVQSVVQDKKSSTDFTLWKAYKEGEPFWEAEWGKGRPGWHIECSAMVSRLFGGVVDFHAGGIDLQFPHHENEEAQSCAFHGNNQWINYWIHTGHLHLKNDVKMSKSLKNTISIDKLLQSHNAETFRMACLISHYRNYMELHDDTMHSSKAILLKMKHFLEDCNMYINNVSFQVADGEEDLFNILNQTKLSVDIALKDDFDTSKCISSIVHLMAETNKCITLKGAESFKPVAVASISKYIVKMMNCFGIFLEKQNENTDSNASDIVDAAVQFRQSVRMRAIEMKDKSLLTECDNLRNTLSAHKIKINDVSKSQSSWIFEK